MSTAFIAESTTLPPGRILFVDDEPALLQGVQRSLRSTRDVWQCDFVDNPTAALDLLRQTSFDVIVADMQMPGLNGAELLAQARQISPDAVRVMLTGNGDLPTALAAVNQGHVFQFLLKPCESDRLIRSLAAALLQHHLQTTERELLRAQLANSDKMIVVGKLAAGINHDLNNILGAILMQTELELHEARQQQTTPNPAFTVIDEAATNAAALTRELNSFSRCERIGEFQNIRLSELIESTARMTRPLLKHKIGLQVELAPDLPVLLGDFNKLERALMNLLLNARDAMPAGGEIKISARKEQITAEAAQHHLRRRAGLYLCLTVSDTGSGMDADLQKHLFQPFFTTKPTGKGMGLGLFMVQRVMDDHAGWVELESAPGHGTTFRLYLPTSDNFQPKEMA